MSETAFACLPWQQTLWDRLQQARKQHRVPHAMLFSGPEGVGKSHFSRLFAQSLICIKPGENGLPCGQCRHCQLLEAGSHPDLHMIEPEEGSKSGEIKIDTIRKLAESASLTAQSGGYKVIIIRPADRMNSAAANSLLKTLEEPTANTVLILITHHPSRLLPTIRSRCQQFPFALPDVDQSLPWLSERVAHGEPKTLLYLAGGAPLKALALDNAEILSLRQEMLQAFLSLGQKQTDPVKLANNWSKQNMQQLLEWLTGWIIDMLRLQTSAQPPLLFNWDKQETLQAIAKQLNSNRLHQLLAHIYEARRSSEGNLNPQLMLETLLIEWSACQRQVSFSR